MSDKIKVLEYNIKDRELENFLKVKENILLDIENCRSGVTYCENQLKRLELQKNMWEEIVRQGDNENFAGVLEETKKALEDVTNQYNKAQDTLKLYKEQFTQLSYIYNNYFNNLPIVDDVCVVSKETIAYCNIAHLLVIERN